jgi:hypothetical protein
LDFSFGKNQQPFSVRGGSHFISWHKEEKRRHNMKVNNMKINVIDGPDDKYYSREFGAAAVAVFAQNQCFDALIYFFLLKMAQNYFFLIF